jgi:hypothetical protein
MTCGFKIPRKGQKCTSRLKTKCQPPYYNQASKPYVVIILQAPSFPNLLFHSPPHETLVNQGTEVTSEFFCARCAEMGIHLVLAPVEIQLSMGLVERIHGRIRQIYDKSLLERA